MNCDFWLSDDPAFLGHPHSSSSSSAAGAAGPAERLVMDDNDDSPSSTALSTIASGKLDSTPVVVKRPTEAKSPGQSGSRFLHELRNLTLLSGSSLCPLLAVRPSDAALVFHKRPHGDVHAYATSNKLNLQQIGGLFKAIVRAVLAVHRTASVIGFDACAHLDLKPKNLLVRAYLYTHIRAHTFVHTHSRTRIRAHTFAHTHTHTHFLIICMLIYLVSLWCVFARVGGRC
jgi:serine/threonine protein kinase